MLRSGDASATGRCSLPECGRIPSTHFVGTRMSASPWYPPSPCGILPHSGKLSAAGLNDAARLLISTVCLVIGLPITSSSVSAQVSRAKDTEPVLTAAAPAATPPPAAAPAAATPAKPKPQAAPLPIEVRLAPAYGNLAVSGSQEDFYHYHRPPSGLFLNLFQVTRRDRAGYPLQEIWWRNLGETDQKGYADLHLRSTPSYLRVWRNTADFYGDPLLPGGQFSNREDTRALMRLRRVTRGPSLDLFVWDQGLSIPAIARLQPFTGIDYHATHYGLRSMLPLGGGQLYLEPRRLSFDDRTQHTPNSDTTWLTGEFVHPIGNRADVSAAYDRITTSVSGRDTAAWNIFRFQGTMETTRRVFFDAFYRQQTIHLPFTETTYENRSSLVGVNVSTYPGTHSSVRAGLFREELTREDGTTRQTSHPAWTGGSLQLRTSSPGLGGFSLRYRDRGLKRAPSTMISALPASETLYYTRDRAVDGRYDRFIGQRVNAYVLYGWRERKNEARATRLTLNTVTLGAAASVSSRLSLSGEFTRQRWGGDTRPFREGVIGVPGNLPPDLFFSDAHILTGDLAYQIDRHSSLDLNYNMFNSTGGQSARDHLAVLQYRRDVSRCFYYSIGYQYERFRDLRLGRDYTAFPLLLQVGLRRDFR
jgi:hypothetical protein